MFLECDWLIEVRCVALRCVVLCCVVLCCAVLRYVVLCCFGLRCVLLCCVALRCDTLCCVVLCCLMINTTNIKNLTLGKTEQRKEYIGLTLIIVLSSNRMRSTY